MAGTNCVTHIKGHIIWPIWYDSYRSKGLPVWKKIPLVLEQWHHIWWTWRYFQQRLRLLLVHFFHRKQPCKNKIQKSIEQYTHFIAVAGKSLNTSRSKTRCSTCNCCYLFHHSEIKIFLKLKLEFWVTNFPCVFSEREALAEILNKYFLDIIFRL